MSPGYSRRLKQAREHAGLSTLTHVVAATGIPHPYLVSWEDSRELSAPSVTSVKRLAYTYGVRAEWLITGDAIETPQRGRLLEMVRAELPADEAKHLESLLEML